MSVTHKFHGQWAVSLLLALALGCSKSSTTSTTPTPTPQATLCQVSKISYDTGEYELYTFDATGLVTTAANYFKDQNGKISTSVTPDKLTYTSQGLLDRNTWGDGTGYEQFTWTNGALSKIEAIIIGKVVYRIDVTTDANKMITGMKSTNVAKDPNYGFDYTTAFTLDAQGRYTKLVATGPDGVFYTQDFTAYEPSIKTPWATFKGYPVFVNDVFINYGQAQPVSAYAITKEVDQYGYDDNGKYVGLKKDYDVTITRTANSNNYPITRKDVDAVGGTTSSKTYQYSNCQ